MRGAARRGSVPSARRRRSRSSGGAPGGGLVMWTLWGVRRVAAAPSPTSVSKEADLLARTTNAVLWTGYPRAARYTSGRVPHRGRGRCRAGRRAARCASRSPTRWSGSLERAAPDSARQRQGARPSTSAASSGGGSSNRLGAFPKSARTPSPRESGVPRGAGPERRARACRGCSVAGGAKGRRGAHAGWCRPARAAARAGSARAINTPEAARPRRW